ncbi:MAG: sigma-E factor negative regulatory protein [Chromatiaceae bacterium]|jgi:sigma-E factor negative regulatory protein RseA
MSEQQRQHVSALVDGELDSMAVHTTLAALAASPDLQAAWERYHLIGNALRGDAIHPEFRQIADRLRARIANEPVPLAPAAARRGGGPSRIGTFLGAALAASAAFLAVFAVPQLFDAGPAVSTARTSAPFVVLKSTPPHLLTERFEVQTSGQRWHVSQPALENKLDRFLVNHQEYSPVALKGLLPYATFVGYETGRQ